MNNAPQPKKGARQDWHRADIVAALRKAGWTLRKLSIHHGYASANTLAKPLDRKWPRGEQLIADALGLHPADIWPSRYSEHTTGSGKGQRVRDRDAV
ncbi:helix-turn-helix domain-containing protein [Arhodomonas aquaeolei]|uniref:helix-turn-helix domain-containing protein n=1 Tax=Arhodomonas aquaeolei TaxID=2369 RepID=UPI0021699495|nr:helix-turn-helix domain-containing protein [Arhodomonas aquaeolei]MCS4503858.1 helix-turn-helix domain-containing protein [Arhodomonas aquaeolei]